MTDPFEQNNPSRRPTGNQEPYSCDGCNTFKRLLNDERERAEQLEVQLAGCGVAALGYNDAPAIKGNYGWSQSYQDVLELRQKYEVLKAENDAYRRMGNRETGCGEIICLDAKIKRLQRDVRLGEEAVCLLQEVVLLEGIEKRGQFYALESVFDQIRKFLKRYNG